MVGGSPHISHLVLSDVVWICYADSARIVALARDEGTPVIVVNIQYGPQTSLEFFDSDFNLVYSYRLNWFGFLACQVGSIHISFLFKYRPNLS
jgi:hypothetical protein